MKFGRDKHNIDRRKKVLQFYAQGHNINEVAQQLYLTRTTVSRDLNKLREMNDCAHKGHLIYKALQSGDII